jgi:hypothetical protein
MKGSNGKKKRSKQAFELKQVQKRNNYLAKILEKRLAKQQFKNEQREREREREEI